MSEFRQDPTSGDWVIIDPKRAARPIEFSHLKKTARLRTPKAKCPFENLKKSGNWPPIAVWPMASGEKWEITVLPNKYPVVENHETAGTCSVPFTEGIFSGMTGVGRHELVIARDHNKNFAELSPAAARQVFGVIVDRCRAAAADPCVNYVVPFMNYGPKSGASIWHPHYQILGLPIIPWHFVRSITGARAYYEKHRSCVRCDVIRKEINARKKDGSRVIAENKNAVAFTPYASKAPFEIRILPKKHFPSLLKTPKAVQDDMADLLSDAMRRLKKSGGDPDLNFFIHEAPVDGKDHKYHHWHIEILPRISIIGGFEFSADIFVNPMDPAAAAAILRGHGAKSGRRK